LVVAAGLGVWAGGRGAALGGWLSGHELLGCNMALHSETCCGHSPGPGLQERDDKGAAVVYTCPMHPEVKSNQPGKCPQCGMDLVPEKPQP